MIARDMLIQALGFCLLCSVPLNALAEKTSQVQVVNPVLAVEVSNADPIPVTVADESARVPYSQSAAPTCPFLNQCLSEFPVVPAGKKLHVTYIAGVFVGTNVAGFVSLCADVYTNMRAAFPVTPFGGAFFGTLISFSQVVDVILDAGQTPVLHFGIGAGGGGITVSPFNSFTITGYLVDASS